VLQIRHLPSVGVGPLGAGRIQQIQIRAPPLEGEAAGALLWRTSLASSVQGSPITYAAGGTQYVAVAAGNLLFAFALRR
jgi:hypothetical protein